MTQHLTRPGGTLGFDVQGSGPLVICVPGMGDLRSSYRHTVPTLVAAGYRVATFDLRGHGDSATTFQTYDDEAAAGDLLAIIDELGGSRAIVLGNSMGAAAAVIAAADRPAAIAGLVLIGPFVRNPPQNALQRAMMAVALRGFWGRSVWRSYYGSLMPAGDPVDAADHRAQADASLRRPGYWQAFTTTARTSHEPAEAVLNRVSAPTLVVMGTKDRDFRDPAAEAHWVADTLHGDVLMVDGAGHYPMAERPDVVNQTLVRFLSTIADIDPASHIDPAPHA